MEPVGSVYVMNCRVRAVGYSCFLSIGGLHRD